MILRTAIGCPDSIRYEGCNLDPCPTGAPLPPASFDPTDPDDVARSIIPSGTSPKECMFSSSTYTSPRCSNPCGGVTISSYTLLSAAYGVGAGGCVGGVRAMWRVVGCGGNTTEECAQYLKWLAGADDSTTSVAVTVVVVAGVLLLSSFVGAVVVAVLAKKHMMRKVSGVYD